MFVVALLAATGLTPVDPDSPNTERIADLYWFISFWAALVLLSVAVPLVLFVFRYRSRGQPRTVEARRSMAARASRSPGRSCRW